MGDSKKAVKKKGLSSTPKKEKSQQQIDQEARIERLNKKRDEVQKATDAVAATPEGRRFLRHLAETSGAFRISSATNNIGYDAHETAFRDGKKAVYYQNIRPLLFKSGHLAEIEAPEVD